MNSTCNTNTVLGNLKLHRRYVMRFLGELELGLCFVAHLGVVICRLGRLHRRLSRIAGRLEAKLCSRLTTHEGA